MSGRSRVATLQDAASRVVMHALGPPLRAVAEGDSAFLDRRTRSTHTDSMFSQPDEHWERLLRSVGLAGNRAVLDVACGPGAWLPVMARLNDRVVAVDIDDDLLAHARARCEGISNVEIAKMSAERLELLDGAFDAVACFSSLPYFQQEPAVAEMARVLEPGGRLVVGTVGPGYYSKHVAEGARQRDVSAVRYGLDPIVVSVARAVGGRRALPRSLKAWTPRAVRRLLERHGLVVDRVVTDVDPIEPSWAENHFGQPVYFVVFATRR